MKILFLLFFIPLISCQKHETKKSVTSIATSTPTNDPVVTCLQLGKNCADVDISHIEAQNAFQKGCDNKDYYSCYRLGQYYEVTKNDLDNALKAYQISCEGKDRYGCESTYDLSMKLCFDMDQKKYCDIREPQGEYRILAFLEGIEKYQDAFINHNFSYPFLNKKVETLFNKAVKEKDQRLLNALYESKKKGKHDGDDGETLQSTIWEIEGKQKNPEGP